MHSKTISYLEDSIATNEKALIVYRGALRHAKGSAVAEYHSKIEQLEEIIGMQRRTLAVLLENQTLARGFRMPEQSPELDDDALDLLCNVAIFEPSVGDVANLINAGHLNV